MTDKFITCDSFTNADSNLQLLFLMIIYCGNGELKNNTKVSSTKIIDNNNIHYFINWNNDFMEDIMIENFKNTGLHSNFMFINLGTKKHNYNTYPISGDNITIVFHHCVVTLDEKNKQKLW